ncbi:MAG: AzlD domain-containing protein [Ruminococcus sp.]|nr:AzlD domain-containing protein [Ruminococcus sp.]
MMQSTYIYLLIMAGVSYIIRVLPMTLIRKPIQNKFFQSFLYYVPYVTLAVMTFPAIIEATQSPVSGLLALILGIAAAWFGADLFKTALLCCAAVLAAEWFLL